MKIFKPKILYPANQSFRIDGEMTGTLYAHVNKRTKKKNRWSNKSLS
jgi:hypothetical protein